MTARHSLLSTPQHGIVLISEQVLSASLCLRAQVMWRASRARSAVAAGTTGTTGDRGSLLEQEGDDLDDGVEN